MGVVRQFEAKCKKNWIFNIFVTISQERKINKRKIAITQPLLQISLPNLVCWWPWSARNVLLCYFGATTKCKMSAGRHLEKRKIAITRPPFEILSPNLARLQAWTVRNVLLRHFSLLTKSKMAAGRHFGKMKISITQSVFEISSPNLVCWWPLSVRNVPWCHFWATTRSRPNPRWRPENFKWPCLCNGSSNPLHVWF